MNKRYIKPAMEVVNNQDVFICADNTSQVNGEGYLIVDSIKDQMPD